MVSKSFCLVFITESCAFILHVSPGMDISLSCNRVKQHNYLKYQSVTKFAISVSVDDFSHHLSQ